MLGAVLVLLVVALGILWFVVAPLLREDASESERVVSAQSEAVELQSRHAMALGALADLEEDRSTGKLDDEDYARLKERLTARAVDIMKKIDALPDKPAGPKLGPRPIETPGDKPA